MNVLVACEYSGIVRDAFRAKGHNAWSCDILPTESDPTYHYQCGVLPVLTAKKWDLLIGHPPCRYITNSGVRWLKNNQDRINNMYDGCDFFLDLLNSGIPKICIENPIPHKYSKGLIGPYTQIIQPWMFGHQETKATCLWLKNLPKLQPTNIVGPPPKNMSVEERKKWHKIHYTSPGKDRGKIRSRFYTGIAQAMANQWG